MSRHLIVTAFVLAALVGCSLEGQTLTSPDHRLRAEVVRSNGTHYQVVEIASGRIILTTSAQFSTPNDVKAGMFGTTPAGELRFAAAYHYGHAGNYTWIGVWTMDGKLVHSTTRPLWTKDLSGVFAGARGTAGGS
jgi:hypothetical protein